MDDTGDEPRLVFRGPVGDAVHLITDIIPWKVKIDATGDEPLMTELRFRGVAFRDVHLVSVYQASACLGVSGCPVGNIIIFLLAGRWLPVVASL